MDSVPGPSRAHLPVRIYPLREQPGDDLSATTTAEERLAMMWPLTLHAWVLSGRLIPPNDRTLVRLVSRAESGGGAPR